jgi:hypothetical protein
MKTLMALSLLFTIGCVHARDPQLVAMKQEGDAPMTCEEVAVEYKSNTEIARSKIAKNRSNDRKELLLGILVWPGLFDLKNADGNEGNALLERNIYLREIAKAKSCTNIDSLPEQPERYTMSSYSSV